MTFGFWLWIATLATTWNPDTQRTLRRELPTQLEALRIVHAHGDCRVFPLAGSQTPRAELTILASGGGNLEESRFLDQVELVVDTDEDGTPILRSVFPDPDSKPPELSFAANLLLWIPDATNLSVENKFGNVEVSSGREVTVRSRLGAVRVADVTGPVDIVCEYGRVEVEDVVEFVKLQASDSVVLRRARGGADVRGKYSEIRLEDCGGELLAENKNAPIVMQRIQGNAHAIAPYGAVDVEGVTGTLRVEGNNADVRINDVGGDVSLNHRHGTLRVSKVGGGVEIDGYFNPTTLVDVEGFVRIDATASDLSLNDVRGGARVGGTKGSIQLREVTGDVVAHGEGGLLLYARRTPWSETDGKVELENRGSVEIQLPDDANCQLEVQSTLGSVECEFEGILSRKSGRVLSASLTLGQGALAIQALAVDSLLRIRKAENP